MPRLIRLIRFVTPALILAACSDLATTDEPAPARIRLIHAAEGVPALDLVVGGTVVAFGVAFEHSSSPVDVPSGTRDIFLRAPGSSTTLASLPATRLDPEMAYTVVAGGTAASLRSSMAVDTGLARTDRANLRIINIADAGGQLLDVFITAPGAPLAGQSQLSLDSRVASYSSLLYFDPGIWQVRFAAAGTTTVVADTGPVPIAAGQVRAVTLSRRTDGSWTVAVIPE